MHIHVSICTLVCVIKIGSRDCNLDICWSKVNIMSFFGGNCIAGIGTLAYGMKFQFLSLE